MWCPCMDMSDSTGGFYKAGTDGLANGSDFDIDPSDSDLGAFELHNIAHGGAVDVKLLADPDGDGSYEENVTLDSLSGSGVSQGNQIEASDDDNMLVRISNTSGGSIDVIVTGREIRQ